MNAGDSKLMIGSSDGNIIVWKVTRHKLLSAQYVKGGFTSGILVVDGFRCKPCDGTIQEGIY